MSTSETSTSPYAGHVVAGTDGSPHGTGAVLLAADEATRRGVGLRIVHAIRVPTPSPPRNAPVEPGQEVRDAAVAVVEDAAAAALERHPDLDVSGNVEFEMPGDALLAAGRDAELLVIGSRGHGGFKGLLLGSVGRYLAARTTGPLLVMRGDFGPYGSEVVVGIQGDGDAAPGRAAVEWARRAGLPVRAIHTWSWPGYPGLAGPTAEEIRAVAAVHEQCLAGALDPLAEEFPDVTVRRESICADAAGALVEASAGAAVTVVGVRHRRGPLKHWVGHVVHSVVEHADGPVLVVPHED